MKNLFRFLLFMVLAAVSLTSCSKDDETTTDYTTYLVFREANLGQFPTYEKEGQEYRPVHFKAMELSSDKVYLFDVYNDDAVAYYGLTGMTTLSGFTGWNYNANSVKAIGFEMEQGKFKLSDGTVLYWVTADVSDNTKKVVSLKDESGNVVYVGWDTNDTF